MKINNQHLVTPSKIIEVIKPVTLYPLRNPVAQITVIVNPYFKLPEEPIDDKLEDKIIALSFRKY